METKVRLSNRSLKMFSVRRHPYESPKYPKSTSKPKHSHFLSLPPSSPIKTSLKKKKTRRKVLVASPCLFLNVYNGLIYIFVYFLVLLYCNYHKKNEINITHQSHTSTH